MLPNDARSQSSAGADRERRAAALRISILAGVFYDWVTALLIFASSPRILSLFRLPPASDPYHFKFAALLLVLLPIFYLLAWRDPLRYSGIVGAMIVARLAGFVYLTVYGWLRGEPSTYLAFGVADLAFALVHAALARRAGLTRRDLFPSFSS